MSTPPRGVASHVGVILMFALSVCPSFTQSFCAEFTGDHKTNIRPETALTMASDALDQASSFYKAGDFSKGDAALDNMVGDLRDCVNSLQAARRGGGNYKKAELKVAFLQRRLRDLVSDLRVEDRGWAEQTERTIDEIHEQLLSGVMKK